MWDDGDYDADELDNERRLAMAERLTNLVYAEVDSIEDALELGKAIRLIRDVKVRLASRGCAA